MIKPKVLPKVAQKADPRVKSNQIKSNQIIQNEEKECFYCIMLVFKYDVGVHKCDVGVHKYDAGVDKYDV
jgi:Zn-dependent M32 family carboxypeptidase